MALFNHPYTEDISIREVYGALLDQVKMYGESSLDMPDRILFIQLQGVFDPQEANPIGEIDLAEDSIES